MADQLYHVTRVENLPSILREGLKVRGGSWRNMSWKPRVFLCTTKFGAYEIAEMFEWDRKGDHLIVRIDPAKLRGKLRSDRDYHQGVWTTIGVPPEAIVGFEHLSDDVFESREYRAYMGDDDEEDACEIPGAVAA